MTEFYYYEYIIKIWDDIDNQEEICSGVVSAESMFIAMKELYDYYGSEIIEVQMLKAITSGVVFEFQSATEDENFDYIIKKK